MFALSNFIATSQHYFVSPMPAADARLAAPSATQGSFGSQSLSSKGEEWVTAAAFTLAWLTSLTAVVAAA
ncbi:hypothetical protein [Roseateles sp.]|jgi:hypothetical protein|uniref:hypothetical protein n=1 Tax=Roseateles sp. TaxID=1971397 RepID=UPI003BA402B0